jgi:hypothetical protein
VATARVDLTSADVVVVPEISGIAPPQPAVPVSAGAPRAIRTTATATTALVPDIIWAIVAVVGVVVAAFVADAVAPDAAFPPQELPTAAEGLTLFALFYVAAQAIERLLEPFSSFLLPNQDKKKDADEALAEAKKAKADAAKSGTDESAKKAETELEKAAKEKAELAALNRHRAILFWGIASVVGIAVSAGMKLYFLQRTGIANSSRWWEILATGLIIGAGTKPLHDLIEFISSKKEGAEKAEGRA